MGRFITQIGQSKAILAFIVILGTIAGYLSYSGSESPVVPDQAIPSTRKDSIESLADFSIDFSILDNEDYKALEIFGENPVNPGITGERRNPFSAI